MRLPSRFGPKVTTLVAALLLVATAGAGEAGPVVPAGPEIHKTTIYNGLVPTVTYTAENGSPRLQALCQELSFTENELNLTGQLQQLRQGIVANEQTLQTLQTSRQLGLGPIGRPGLAARYAPPDSALKTALIPGLAREAKPTTAYQLIALREQVQTELLAEQGKPAGAANVVPPALPNALPAAPAAGAAAAPRPAAVLWPAKTPPAAAANAPRAAAQQLPMPQVGLPNLLPSSVLGLMRLFVLIVLLPIACRGRAA
jgi:hypothetical protein